MRGGEGGRQLTDQSVAKKWALSSEFSPTMLLLRFLSTLQKVWGGVSPFPGMMTQTSVTASDVCGWLLGARRYVM